MKILIIARNTSDTLGFHLLETLRANSECNVLHYDYYLFRSKNLRYFVRILPVIFFPIHKILLFIKGVSRYDMVLCTYKNIYPGFFHYLKKKGLYLVSLNPDHLGTLGNQELIKASFDAYWVKCRIMHRQFNNKTDLRSIFYNEAYSKTYNFIEPSNYYYDILFVGSMYPYRWNFIKMFIREISGVTDKELKILVVSNVSEDFREFAAPNIKIHNTGFKFLHQKRRVFSSCKLAINLMHISEIESSNAKFIEFIAMGIPQLVDFNPFLRHDLSNTFLEKFSFGSVTECVHKALIHLDSYDDILKLYLEESRKIKEGKSYEELLSKIITDYLGQQ